VLEENYKTALAIKGLPVPSPLPEMKTLIEEVVMIRSHTLTFTLSQGL
jgi:hypothetical protein